MSLLRELLEGHPDTIKVGSPTTVLSIGIASGTTTHNVKQLGDLEKEKLKEISRYPTNDEINTWQFANEPILSGPLWKVNGIKILDQDPASTDPEVQFRNESLCRRLVGILTKANYVDFLMSNKQVVEEGNGIELYREFVQLLRPNNEGRTLKEFRGFINLRQKAKETPGQFLNQVKEIV